MMSRSSKTSKNLFFKFSDYGGAFMGGFGKNLKTLKEIILLLLVSTNSSRLSSAPEQLGDSSVCSVFISQETGAHQFSDHLSYPLLDF